MNTETRFFWLRLAKTRAITAKNWLKYAGYLFKQVFATEKTEYARECARECRHALSCAAENIEAAISYLPKAAGDALEKVAGIQVRRVGKLRRIK